MDRSSKKIRRIVDVFHDLATVERAKIGQLQREMDELRASQDDALKKLADGGLQGPFIALLSSSVGRIERRLQRLAREHEIALERYAAAAARGRSAVNLLSEVRADEARKFEQRELEALIEFQEGRAAQGRGKARRSP
jgi:hypothetical protein